MVGMEGTVVERSGNKVGEERIFILYEEEIAARCFLLCWLSWDGDGDGN